ncbi:hypothetical protein [Blastococcus deserti]|uniref:Antibiotic biosynthesis monooxygenase n=1 Tax=Blastococcus deserti TaxID=2259033 RepID=A0ABW4X5B4_9ACTN
MPGGSRFTVVSLIDLPPESVTAFQRYEDAVLPLLHRHDGRLERRLRTPDGTTEVHVLSFSSEAAYGGYLDDPQRVDHRSLLDGVELTTRVVESLSEVP